MPEPVNNTTSTERTQTNPYSRRTERTRAVTEQKPRTEAEEKPVRRRKRKRRPLLIIIPSLLLLAAAAVLLLLARSVADYKLKEPVTQYYAGSSYDLPGGTLRLNDDGGTQLVTKGNSVELTSLPLYFKNSDAVLLPKDMVYYEPDSSIKLRVNHFSTLKYYSGTTTVSSGRRSKALTAGFLYDGDDLFFLLQPASLEYNNYQIELSAFSYVEVNKDRTICYYNYETGENAIDDARTAVEIRPNTAAYSVQIISDELNMDDGRKILLFNRADLLDSLL